MKSIFSVDVEDWFHILDVPSTPPISAWDALPSHVEKNFRKLLDIFSEKDARVTCFFLGYVGRRFPHLVQEAVERGHETASHGFAHRLAYEMTEEEFYEDARSARRLLEDIAGQPIHGYRSAGFSITKDTPWFFDALARAGYTYDSSVFPAPHGHGGLMTGQFAPYSVPGLGRSLLEFPVTVVDVLNKPTCFLGGGYLRLFPYPLVKAMSRRVLAEGRPVVFYVHPREIDPNHPRLPMNLKRTFKSYVNLKTMGPKIRKILDDFEVTTFSGFMTEYAHTLEMPR